MSEMKFWSEPAGIFLKADVVTVHPIRAVYFPPLVRTDLFPDPEVTWLIPSVTLCLLSVTCVCVCGFLSPFEHCSVPGQAPQTVTVHTAVARVPSPTLVCRTVPPYRYMQHDRPRARA